MKTKFKKNGRRLLSAILCLVMAVMALPMSAFAWTSEEGVSCTSSFGDYYVGSDGGSSKLSSCASKRLRAELLLTSLLGNMYSSTEMLNIVTS